MLPIIQTERLKIRPFLEQDISVKYLSWLNNKILMQYSNQRFLEHSFKSSFLFLESFRDTPNHFLAILDATEKELLGTMTVYHSEAHQVADMGILSGPKNSGARGAGGEAWRAVLTFLLDNMEIRKVTAGTLASNTAMIKLAKGSGMKLEAIRKEQELVDAVPVDILYFAKFANIARNTGFSGK